MLCYQITQQPTNTKHYQWQTLTNTKAQTISFSYRAHTRFTPSACRQPKHQPDSTQEHLRQNTKSPDQNFLTQTRASNDWLYTWSTAKHLCTSGRRCQLAFELPCKHHQLNLRSHLQTSDALCLVSLQPILTRKCLTYCWPLMQSLQLKVPVQDYAHNWVHTCAPAPLAHCGSNCSSSLGSSRLHWFSSTGHTQCPPW